MNTISKIIFAAYTLLVILFSISGFIFLGILADENVKFDSFAKVYIFGVELNYNVIPYSLGFLLIATIAIQIAFYSKFLRKSN
ncbi:MAG: hypothetical protein AAGF07_00015 [Patescibacteria group bacterium]